MNQGTNCPAYNGRTTLKPRYFSKYVLQGENETADILLEVGLRKDSVLDSWNAAGPVPTARGDATPNN